MAIADTPTPLFLTFRNNSTSTSGSIVFEDLVQLLRKSWDFASFPFLSAILQVLQLVFLVPDATTFPVFFR